MTGTGDPSTRQLRLFLLLAEELHFGRAARRSYMTQPAFSQQIRSLEKSLGVTLVERTTRTVGLTHAGQELVAQARGVVEAADRLRRAAAEHQGGLPRRVLIGSLESGVFVEPVKTIFETFKERNPGLEVSIRSAGFTAAVDLLDGEVDVSFLLGPVPPGIQTLPLGPLPRKACMAASDPLAGQGPLTLAQLAARPYIGWSDKVPQVWRDFWACDPRPDGTPVRYSSDQVEDFESGLAAIAQGAGIQLPPAVSETLYRRPGVAYVEVSDLPPGTMALAWRTEDRDRPLVSALRAIAQAALGRGAA